MGEYQKFDTHKLPLILGTSREPNPEHDTLMPYLLKGVQDENGLDQDFIKEAIKRFDDDEMIPALFDDAMVQISNKLAGMSMDDDYKPYIQVRFSNLWKGQFYLRFGIGSIDLLKISSTDCKSRQTSLL